MRWPVRCARASFPRKKSRVARLVVDANAEKVSRPQFMAAERHAPRAVAEFGGRFVPSAVIAALRGVFGGRGDGFVFRHDACSSSPELLLLRFGLFDVVLPLLLAVASCRG